MWWVNFIKVLDQAIYDIENKLLNIKENKYKEIKSSVFNSEQQKQLYKEAEELELKAKELKQKAALLDPSMTVEEEKEYIELTSSSTWNKRKSDLLTVKELVNDSSVINVEEFKKIKTKFQNMIKLAVWSKEQREILLRFYSIDWKQLWIDVPPDIDIKSVTVENWILNSGIKLISN